VEPKTGSSDWQTEGVVGLFGGVSVFGWFGVGLGLVWDWFLVGLGLGNRCFLWSLYKKSYCQ
jgi:hypothetical protein